MAFDPEIHHRRSIRLRGHDYSFAGAYFITACVRNRMCLFGQVVDEEIRLNEYGEIAKQGWDAMPDRFPNVKTDVFVVMPNHIHGIIVITDNCRGGVTPPLRRPTLGNIIAYYKYQTTKLINQIRNAPGNPVWQRNYFEHIIRDETELNLIREYIAQNPRAWATDRENPECGSRVTPPAGGTDHDRC